MSGLFSDLCGGGVSVCAWCVCVIQVSVWCDGGECGMSASAHDFPVSQKILQLFVRNYKNRFYKTRPCKFALSKTGCKNGRHCKFIHPNDNFRKPQFDDKRRNRRGKRGGKKLREKENFLLNASASAIAQTIFIDPKRAAEFMISMNFMMNKE